MIELLKTKQAIFFDLGYTLVYPKSGDWMFTQKFYELAGEAVKKYSVTEIQGAKDRSFEYLAKNHHLTSVEEECKQFEHYYREISRFLNLGFTDTEIRELAHDRTYNMQSYISYPGVSEVLKTLGKTHKLGIISDTWPSIELQLQSLGLDNYFSTRTFSCDIGTFKPDKRMYMDALVKMKIPAKDTVFIDDIPQNLAGAAELGITSVLIAANPVSDVDVPYRKIYSIQELLL